MSMTLDAVKKRQYVLMHKDNEVLTYDLLANRQQIIDGSIIPYGYRNNQFIAWCASRVLSISRKNAKYILNTLGVSQDNSDYTRARLALAYHCVSLNDCYWVKRINEDITWQEVSLFNNKSENILTPVSLQGKVSILFNKKLDNSCDLTAEGTYRKSWVRKDDSFELYKGNDSSGSNEVDREVYASKVLSILGFDSIHYEFGSYNDETISISKCFTNESKEFIPFHDVKVKFGKGALGYIKSNWSDGYYKMAIATYLIGNIDLHDGNWGLYHNLEDDSFSFASLFDFNNALTEDYLSSKDVKSNWIPEVVAVDIETGEEVDSEDIFDFDIRYKSDYTIESMAEIAAKKLKEKIDITKLDISYFMNEKYMYECLRRCNKINNWVEEV